MPTVWSAMTETNIIWFLMRVLFSINKTIHGIQQIVLSENSEIKMWCIAHTFTCKCTRSVHNQQSALKSLNLLMNLLTSKHLTHLHLLAIAHTGCEQASQSEKSRNNCVGSGSMHLTYLLVLETAAQAVIKYSPSDIIIVITGYYWLQGCSAAVVQPRSYITYIRAAV